MLNNNESFFSKDKKFYRNLFGMLVILALQNLVAYSVNMADNIMLGSYSQAALSGAATVNQVFFMVQQFALSIGNALVVLASQYWGQNRIEPVRKLVGIALKVAILCGIIILIVCMLIPEQLLRIFTDSQVILDEGLKYLAIIKWTFFLYLITNVLMAALRSVEIVNISFKISLVSLIVNVGINYVLIFGKFGLPELGIIGAGIGTMIARVVELLIVIAYIVFVDDRLDLVHKDLLLTDKTLLGDYIRVGTPIACSQVLWGISVPMQTAILGHLSADAIAANSVATTFYQYLKVIVIAMSSVSAVMIGKAIGEGDIHKVKENARTLVLIDLIIGVILGAALVALSGKLLALYDLTPNALHLSSQLMLVMGVVMVGMSYQMPVSFGIIQGAGDTKFTMYMNTISTWLIVIPLSFAAAFWWKLPVWLVVLVVQSDQIFKGLPTFIRFRSYKWINKLTREA